MTWCTDPDPAYYAEMEREEQILRRSEMYDAPVEGADIDRGAMNQAEREAFRVWSSPEAKEGRRQARLAWLAAQGYELEAGGERRRAA
jgi:hypothetical protein